MPGIYGQLVGAQAENLNGTPTAGKPGRLVWDSSTSKLAVDTGSVYINLASGTQFAAVFPWILGSSAQVTAGTATHSSWASVISAAASGDQILVLVGSWTESVTITKQLCIIGQGRGTILTGTLTFNSSSDKSLVKHIYVSDNITFSSGADDIQLVDFWQASGKTITDSGSSNYVHGIRE